VVIGGSLTQFGRGSLVMHLRNGSGTSRVRFWDSVFRFQVLSFEVQVSSFEFRFLVFGFQDLGLRFTVEVFGSRVEGGGERVRTSASAADPACMPSYAHECVLHILLRVCFVSSRTGFEPQYECVLNQIA